MVISLKKSLLLIIPFFILILGLVFYLGNFEIKFNGVVIPARSSKVIERLPLDKNEVLEEKEYNEIPSFKKETESPLPQEFLLDVPFAPQSPYAVWDERDEESCEEASIVIVHYFWQKKNLAPELMRQELDALIGFQISHYGDYKDSDARGIARLAYDYYGYEKAKVYYDITIDDIKREIVQGNPVIIPAAGRALKNPYYTPPGPLYHNLVLIGFNDKGIITCDPGTRRGKGYFYPYDVLYKAIHDFPGSKEKIEEGRKAMIIIE